VATIQSTDQIGNKLEINFPPKRIISLVPSQTELLFDLGLYSEIIGLTRFCIHPADKVKMKEKIGGTKRFNIEKIKSLKPDLIIGNKEENYLEGIEALKQHFPVWISDIYNLSDAYKMMNEVARITNKVEQGTRLVNEIGRGFENVSNSDFKRKGFTAAYFIWRKPYMVAANNTFIDFMLQVFGVHNVFKEMDRYPEIEPEVLKDLQPDFIFLSSEPYSFTEKHIAEFQESLPHSKVILVDGEMFSWYGSRLKLVPAYFSKLRSEYFKI
jgi:ABC-type Fe3+-hydroxamate transport system substrate-binding protein